MDRRWQSVRRLKGRNDFCAPRRPAHVPLPRQDSGPSHVRHYSRGVRGVLRGNLRSHPAATAGHPARARHREEIRPGNSAPAQIVSPSKSEIIRIGQTEVKFLLEAADTNGSVAIFEFTVPA